MQGVAERPPSRSPAGVRVFLHGMIAWAIGAAIFFRIALLSGFALVSGNGGDGLQNVYVQEHVYQWLIGHSNLDSPPFYYPQQHVCGYFDAFLLDLPLYTAFRLSGLDPFLSQQLLLVVLSLICFWSVWHLLTAYAHTGPYIALAAAGLISFPNDLFLKAVFGHLTTFAIYFLPPIIAIATRGLRNFPQVSASSVAFVALASALYGLLFSTGYYIAWMFGLTVLIASLYLGLTLRQRILPWMAANRVPAGIFLGAALAGFAAALIPFFVIHASALALYHGRTFRDYLAFSPFPYDVINASHWNIVWGRLIDLVLGSAKAQEIERALAITPGMTLIFLCYVWAANRRLKRNEGTADWPHYFAMAAAVVWAASWILTLRIGSVSLFWLMFHALPGANAIRVGGRIQLLVNLWVVAALAILVDRQLSSPTARVRRLRQAIAAVVFLFCLVEQVNANAGGLPRGRLLAELAAVPPPPGACGSFLVAPSRREVDAIDDATAMWISWKISLPTLNGTSPWTPPGWHLDGPSTGYFGAATDWITHAGIRSHVCLYYRSSRTWAPFGPHA